MHQKRAFFRITLLLLCAAFVFCAASCQSGGIRIESVNDDGTVVVSDGSGNKYVYEYYVPAEEGSGTEEEKQTMTVNLLEYGAAGDGETDDSKALKGALSSLAKTGGTLYIPGGTYLITENVRVAFGNLTIRGDGASTNIVYRREQKDGETFERASLFTILDSPSNITVRDIKLTYDGSFFGEAGQSYSGLVSGICINTGSDICIKNAEICGFNQNGVVIQGSASTYVKRVSVIDCNLHDNRVAGVLYGYVDGLTIAECSLCNNGAEKDGGTGYGCAGWSGMHPKNILVIGNVADGNSRKGLDVHAGERIVIDGNTCKGNGLYGIYAEGELTSDITITNNVVSDIPTKNDYGELYTAKYGICVGSYAVPEDGEYHNYTISNNVIRDFIGTEGMILPLYLYCPTVEGFVKITENIIDTGTADYILVMSRTEAGTDNKFNVDISSNDIRVGTVRSVPMILCGKRLSFSDNIISLGKCDSQVFSSLSQASGGSETIFRDNVLTVKNGPANIAFLSGNALKGHISDSNFINGKNAK